jgi:glycogen debranching enzyme
MHRIARDVDGSREFLRWLYPRLVARHRYFADERDPTRVGLTSFVHPWEAGLDNSPAWDRDLTKMVIPDGAIPPYVRHDLAHGDPKDRPTNEAYDRFVYLAAHYRDSAYDDRGYPDSVPFTVAGPLFNAIFLWSEHALAEIARIVGADPDPHREAAEKIHRAIGDHLWDPETKRFCALDVVRGERSAENTIVSFMPLLDPNLPKDQIEAIVADLHSASFHPARKISYVVPSYDLLAEDFNVRQYWRGPIWINTNWLLLAGLRQHGYHSLADQVLVSSLRLVATSGFREYFDPFDATGYGTDGFGWTAALVIDLIERHPEKDRERLIEQLAAS